MQLYSDFPRPRARQIVADTIALVAIGSFVALGVTVGALISTLASLGRDIESAGNRFQGTMSDAATALGSVPLIGGSASSPFQ